MANHEIQTLEQEIASLQETLRGKQEQLRQLKTQKSCPYSNLLSTDEIVRYSRQMIMHQLAPRGQEALRSSKILIVGAGGLGCPAALYLAAAGVGEIHVVDYDQVELSNLHRQILHTEADIGVSKAQSVCDKLRNINSNVKAVPLHIHASGSLIDEIKKHAYDVVLDCSDNAPTRYLLNDVCVISNIPLVSGSALQMQGQLTVYHYEGGPCYRCVFPTPPPAETVTNCGDGGVLGAVTGVIGSLQALETIKILTNAEGVLSGRLLVFDASETVFRNFKLRYKSTVCDVCSDNPKITKPIDYETFCGSKAHDKVVDIDVLTKDENIDAKQLKNALGKSIVLDVRPELEFEMCQLPNTINFPFTKIQTDQGFEQLKQIVSNESGDKSDVYVLCRRGNDSQRSVALLKKQFPGIRFVNVKGGLHAYSKIVDPEFPIY